MANNKEQNAMMLDPNRFKIAKNMTTMPGGPMNNNPMNVTGIGGQSSSLSGVNQYPYGDSGMAAPPQLGADVLNPFGVQNSGIGSGVMGQKLNGQIPFGYQNQPSPNAEEPMEGMRLGMEAANRGLNSSQFMGPVGSGAMMPGALDPTIPGGGTPLGMMPTSASVDAGQMVPGSTPTKKGQKRGKK